jgi:hypothetical protein
MAWASVVKVWNRKTPGRSVGLGLLAYLSWEYASQRGEGGDNVGQASLGSRTRRRSEENLLSALTACLS